MHLAHTDMLGTGIPLTLTPFLVLILGKIITRRTDKGGAFNKPPANLLPPKLNYFSQSGLPTLGKNIVNKICTKLEMPVYD